MTRGIRITGADARRRSCILGVRDFEFVQDTVVPHPTRANALHVSDDDIGTEIMPLLVTVIAVVEITQSSS